MGCAARLWIIDPSENHAEDEGVAEILEGWDGEHRVFQPSLRKDGPSREAGYPVDGVVLMGSAVSVHQRSVPWLDRLGEWLAPLLLGEPEVPVLGICFGHQLIAHLAGGRVGFVSPDHSKILGIQTAHLSGGRLLPGSHDLRVVVSHREEVKQAPPGYRVVATRPGFPVDGLEHSELPIFSYQFHPEARREFARRAGIDPATIDQRLRRDSRRVLAAFRERVRTKADPERPGVEQKRAGG